MESCLLKPASESSPSTDPAVYSFVEKKIKKNSVNYIFLDEVQNVIEFEKLLKGLFVHTCLRREYFEGINGRKKKD